MNEPSDASGIDTILLYYENDTGIGIWIDVTGTSNYTFLESLLEYNQNFTWFFWVNDTASNYAQTSNYSFTVEDRTSPNI